MTDLNIAITKEDIEKDDIPLPDIFKSDIKLKIIALPTITTIPLYSKDISDSIKKIENAFYDYYIFLSANSVNIFFKIIKKEKNYNNIIKAIQRSSKNNYNNIIAIGPKTKKEIEKYNLKAYLSSAAAASTNYSNSNIILDANTKTTDYSLNSIMEFLENLDKSNENEKIKILIPRSTESQKSNNLITKKYTNLILDQVFFYETIEFNKIIESNEWKKFKNLVEQKELKYIIFTSPSTVRAFFKIIANNIYLIEEEKEKEKENRLNILFSTNKNEQELINDLGIKLIISIGPKTSEELKKRDIVYLESAEHTINGALKCLLKSI
jgi:uroporphyrinogen-III synthase